MGFYRVALSVQSNDSWRSFEGTKHQDNSPVFLQMGNRLHTAADYIDIRYSPRPEDSKSIQSLRRKIDVPFRCQRRSGHEEDRLRPNHLRKLLINFDVHFTQESSSGWACNRSF